MNSISEQSFKLILDNLWNTFNNSMGLIDILESIGLNVDPTESKTEEVKPNFGALYSLQGKVTDTILNIFGLDKESRCEDKKQTVLEELDQFLFDLHTECFDYDEFPIQHYQELLSLFKDAGVKLPWEKKSIPMVMNPEPYYEHRALSKSDMKPVVGYIWNGNDHSYIIPHNTGISYDEKDKRLQSFAIEVWKPTIALKMQFTDVNHKPLFEGDLVRIGDDTFHLYLTDPEVVHRLASTECKKLGLFLVRPNYDGFEPEK